MIGAREPKRSIDGGLTVLDCNIGGHAGAFTITRVFVEGRRAWGCDQCIEARGIYHPFRSPSL